MTNEQLTIIEVVRVIFDHVHELFEIPFLGVRLWSYVAIPAIIFMLLSFLSNKKRSR